MGEPASPIAALTVDADSPTPRSPIVRAVIVLAALVAATVAALVAPADWPVGPAELRVELSASSSGEPVGLAPVAVEVGSTAAVSVRRDTPDGEVLLDLPDGVPDAGVVRLDVVAVDDGVRFGLADLTATLHLSDGQQDDLVVLGVDGDTVQFERRAPNGARVVLALLAFVVVLWVTEVVPLFVASLLVPVVLVVAGVQQAQPALAPFFHPIIALFFAGFLLAEAMRRVGLDRVVATRIVARAATGPRRLFGALLVTAAAASMVMSNTAAVALLIPIALTVTTPLGSRPYQKVVVLGIAYAATIGGVGSVIGTPANLLAVEFLDDVAGRTITFVEWFTFGVPMLVVLLPVMAGWLWWRGGVDIDPARFEQARAAARRERADHARLDRSQVHVLVVFLAVVAGWLTQSAHGLDTATIALAGVIALAATGRILPADLGTIQWDSLLTFGGGLALGRAITEAGVADWIALSVTVLADLPAGVAIAAVAIVSLALTTVASNTASAATLIPLAIPVAALVGADPTVLVVTVAIASSVDFALVIGTPPTMLAYSTRLFTTREILRTGAVLDLVAVGLLVTIVAWSWTVLGVV